MCLHIFCAKVGWQPETKVFATFFFLNQFILLKVLLFSTKQLSQRFDSEKAKGKKQKNSSRERLLKELHYY